MVWTIRRSLKKIKKTKNNFRPYQVLKIVFFIESYSRSGILEKYTFKNTILGRRSLKKLKTIWTKFLKNIKYLNIK